MKVDQKKCFPIYGQIRRSLNEESIFFEMVYADNNEEEPHAN